MRTLSILIAGLLIGPHVVAADQPDYDLYAVVIGANTGAAGQDTLDFAESDAERVATVLQNVGHYRDNYIIKLTQPSSQSLQQTLAEMRNRLQNRQRGGEKTLFLFFYSGHSRAEMLNLGKEEVPLSRLRSELESLPATLKVVILDACQSGAFSKVKGVRATEDFSVNSINQLNASGIAVMASSTASELSQESKKLGSSFFTHYLVVALLGAGDKNLDGKVTLEEAYQYAYHRTLAATAVTAVGKQHVTFETALRGKGEVPLTYPMRSGSSMVLPKSARGDFLITNTATQTVVAEVHKVPRQTVQLALPPGSYQIIVTDGGKAQECQHRIPQGGVSVFEADNCRRIDLETYSQKGLLRGKRWGIETSVGFGDSPSDAYTRRLEDFGYRDIGILDELPHLEIALTRHLASYFHAGLHFMTLGSGHFERFDAAINEEFSWSSMSAAVSGRAAYPVLRWGRGRGGIFPFFEGKVGLVRAETALKTAEMTDRQTDWGYSVTAAGGMQVMITSWIGPFAKLSYAYAPTIDNRLGDTKNVGGWFLSAGARVGF
jgi:hypothetical protein